MTLLCTEELWLSLEDIRHMPRVIGIAGGDNKVEAILGALRVVL